MARLEPPMKSPTGRSSEGPDLQNIPLRTELGRRVREEFVREAPPHEVETDYASLEWRAMAEKEVS